MHRHASLMMWLIRATLMITTLPILAGCTTMIATSGISGSHEIPTELSRKEVHERFGSPASSGTTAAGRRTESFSIRQRLVAAKSVSDFYSVCNQGRQDCHPGIVALYETVGFPIVVVISEMKKLV